jgi:predicted dehydrogenase
MTEMSGASSDRPVRVGVIGAGSHSRREHLPSLARYASERPGEIELAILCDRRVDVAAEMAGQFGFAAHGASLDDLLAAGVDAIVAVTPVDVTAEIAMRVLAAGVPLLMEKPIGRDEAEARRVAGASAGKAAMVSMNRRFDPGVAAAAEWLRGRGVTHARATVVRHAREPRGFVEDVGVHAVDTLRFLAGDIADVRATSLRFASGASGAVELIPAGGHWVETYDVFGPGFHVQANATVGCKVWHENRVVLETTRPADTPGFVASGAYAETAAFLDSVRGRRGWLPTPADVLQSELACFELVRQLGTP